MLDVNYVMDTPEAVCAAPTIRTRFIEMDEPPEARTIFQWSDTEGSVR